MARKKKKDKPGRCRAAETLRARPVPDWVWKLADLIGRLVIAAIMAN